MNWDVLVDDTTGNLQGRIALNGVTPQYTEVMAYYGGWQTKRAAADGSYLFANIPTGPTPVTPHVTLNEPYGTLSLPRADVHIVAGQTTQLDFIYDTARVTGEVHLNGFAKNTDAEFISMSAEGLNMNGYDSVNLATGAFDFLLIPGHWNIYRGAASFKNFADPLTPLDSMLNFDYYDRAYNWGGSEGTRVAANDNLTVAPFNIETVEAEIIFDVIEQPGAPEIKFSNAQVDGRSFTTHADGNPERISASEPMAPKHCRAAPR